MLWQHGADCNRQHDDDENCGNDDDCNPHPDLLLRSRWRRRMSASAARARLSSPLSADSNSPCGTSLMSSRTNAGSKTEFSVLKRLPLRVSCRTTRRLSVESCMRLM